MAESDIELPPGYTSTHDLEMPPGYSVQPGASAPASAAPAAKPSMMSRVGNYIAEEGLPIAGGIAGAMLGAPGGPPGMIAGATLGGAGGRAIQRDLQYVTGSRDPAADTALGNMGDIGRAGLAQGASEVLGQGAGALWRAARPGVVNLASQAEQVMTGTPEKFAKNLLNRPAEVAASNPEAASDAYQAGLPGLQSLRDQIQAKVMASKNPQAFIGEAQYEKEISKAFNNSYAKMKAGKLSPQDALNGVQASNYIQQNLLAKPGTKAVRKFNQNVLIEGEEAFKDFLEQQGFPIRQSSQQYFDAMTKDAFSSALPLNKNMSPNALRGFSALGAGVAGFGKMTDNQNMEMAGGGMMLAPLAVSPLAHYFAVQAASKMAPYLGTGADAASRAALQSYMDQPRNPAPPLAPR